MSGIDVALTTLLEDVMVLALQKATGPQYGKVDSYDQATGRVRITTVVPLLQPDGDVIAAVTLPSVPVAWPGSTTHGMQWPIPAGSIMVIKVLGHDHSEWMTSGTTGVTPKNDRKFSLSDLVAEPLSPFVGSAPPDPTSYDAAWGVIFGQWMVGDNTAAEFVALATKVLTELTAITDYLTTGMTMQAGTLLDSTGGACTGATGLVVVAPTAPGSVACTKLKAL